MPAGRMQGILKHNQCGGYTPSSFNRPSLLPFLYINVCLKSEGVEGLHVIHFMSSTELISKSYSDVQDSNL